MSCHGKTDYHANDITDWHEFKMKVTALAEKYDDPAFMKYVNGVTDKVWAHILEENFFTVEQCAKRFRNFYESDVLAFKK